MGIVCARTPPCQPVCLPLPLCPPAVSNGCARLARRTNKSAVEALSSHVFEVRVFACSAPVSLSLRASYARGCCCWLRPPGAAHEQKRGESLVATVRVVRLPA
jgi:hypothetical protein